MNGGISMKKIVTYLLLGIFTITLLSGCGNTANTNKQSSSDKDTNTKIVLKAAHVLSNTSHYHKGMEKLAELVKAKTNGQVEIQIYPNSILGSERDLIEGLQLGTVDIALVSTAPIGQFSPKMMLFDLPFIFRDSNHAWTVADGPIGDELFADLNKKGIMGLAYWENGFRHVFTKSKEIKTPEDFKGQKIRVMENPIHIATFKALDAIPSPLAWGELFTALQQGTVDGAENSLSVIYTSRFQEVCKNIALTGHFYGIAPLLMSKISYDKLSDEQKKAIKEAALEARDFQRQVAMEMEKDIISKLESEGVKVTEVDRSAFQEKCKKVYKEFESQIPAELINKVIETK
jgi:tripartite ATP-independent transporter DctP family solute receptor